MILDAGERARLARDGYLVREGVLARDECAAVCHGLSAIVRAAARDALARRRVATFWEAMARSASANEVFWDAAHDLLSQPEAAWERAVMRVGHTLHRVAPFDALARDPRLALPLASVIAEPAEIIQSAITYKQPRSERVQFGWHQDSSYLPNEPESIVLAFVALDDMTAENGALEVIPGSHRRGLLCTYRLSTEGEGEGYVPVERQAARADDRGALRLTMARGSVVFVHGRTQHASGPNRSDSPRRAFILHAKAARSRMLPYCWTTGPFDPLPASAEASGRAP